jgi:tetratricopeptide (TPR) repeat protein
MKRRTGLFLIAGAGILIACAAWVLYSRRPAASPAPVVSYTEQATGLAKSGQITESVIQYNRAIAMAPTEPEPYIGLAVLYESLNRPDLAIETLEQLQAANPRAKHLSCRLAEAHLGADSMQTAKELGEKATAEEPDCARAHSVCGLALMTFRYYDRAAAMLLKAQQLAPEDSQIGETLVDVYLRQAQYTKATEVGESLVVKSPNAARLRYLLGWAYSRISGNKEATERAVTHLEKARELSPEWFEPSAELGRLYKSIGRNAEALACFERAWKLNSSAPGVAYNLAALWRQSGDPRADAMEKTYRRLLAGKERFTQLRLRSKSDSEDAAKILAMSDAEARNGLYGTALYRLHKLLVSDPGHVEALQLYIRLDRQIRARYPNYLRPGPGLGLPRS